MKFLDLFEADRELVEDLQREPLSPGALFEARFMPLFRARGFSKERIAKAMGMSRQSLDRFRVGEKAVTADLAAKLAYVTGTSLQLWLNMQRAVDLYRIKNEEIAEDLTEIRDAYSAERERFMASQLETLPLDGVTGH